MSRSLSLPSDETCRERSKIFLKNVARYKEILKSYITEKKYEELEEILAANSKNSKDNQNNSLITPPKSLTATLKPHQIEGLSWLVNQYNTCTNSILGDEMGLGSKLN